MKVKLRSKTSEAHQWWKNGDHPDDGCQSGLPIGEGKVVSFFPPHVGEPDHCSSCKRLLLHHGFLDPAIIGGNMGEIVCPGDYIITDSGGIKYSRCKQADFVNRYEVIPEPPLSDDIGGSGCPRSILYGDDDNNDKIPPTRREGDEI